MSNPSQYTRLMDLAARRVEIAERELGAAQAASDAASAAVLSAEAALDGQRLASAEARDGVLGRFVGAATNRLGVGEVLSELKALDQSVEAAVKAVEQAVAEAAKCRDALGVAAAKLKSAQLVAARREAALRPAQAAAKRQTERSAEQRRDEEFRHVR